MNQLPKLICPLCQGDKFDWGNVAYMSSYGLKTVVFTKNPGFWQRLSTAGAPVIRAATCERCGYVLQFRKDKQGYIDPDEKRGT